MDTKMHQLTATTLAKSLKTSSRNVEEEEEQ